MEAASAAGKARNRFPTLSRDRVSKYGLVVLLLAMPVWFAIDDLTSDGSLTRLGNNFVDGLSNGSIWALVALGYTLVYGIIELINFAHGDLFMIGSFVSVGIFGTLGIGLTTSALGITGGLIVTLIIAMLACALLNVMIERVAYRPLRNAPK